MALMLPVLLAENLFTTGETLLALPAFCSEWSRLAGAQSLRWWRWSPILASGRA
jgi:hypothetical protein